MMRRILLALGVLLCGAAVAVGQDEDEKFTSVDVRVIANHADQQVEIDRGENDGLAAGDLVFLYPIEGGNYRGRVIEVKPRSSMVRLRKQGLILATGTRGEVVIPKERLEAPAKDEDEEVTALIPIPNREEPAPEAVEWTNKDEAWTQGMPLLAEVEGVRPEDRGMRLRGRYYIYTDVTSNPSDTSEDFSNSLFRTGTDLSVENPFGKGGSLRFYGEVNYLTEYDENTQDLGLLLQRFSYTLGGDRFSTSRWEMGRFLHYGMPEFGVIDGVEYNRRRNNGDRWGASIGYLPVPDNDFQSGHDFGISAFYEWVKGDQEQFAWANGYQKTFHNGNADRDLWVSRFRYLPLQGWDFNATTWVDYYTDGDGDKSTLELTQAIVQTGRRWDTGNSVDVSYVHQEFPAIDRFEFVQTNSNQLIDNRQDRVSLRGWRWAGWDTGVHGQVGAWADQGDSGGDFQLGVDVRDKFGKRSSLDLTGFATYGKFESLVGGRVTYGKTTIAGRWDAFYEFAEHHLFGFSSGRDDLFQHRFGLSKDWYSDSGWSLNVFGLSTIYDDVAWSLGFNLQKSFY